MRIKPKIGIICPVYNEAENIEIFFNEFTNIFIKTETGFEHEFLFLDNDSEDGSFQIMRRLVEENENVFALRYTSNFGVMKSIYTGILNAPADWAALAVFDCDLQDPPELVLSLLSEWRDGTKIVFGSRAKRQEGLVYKVLRNTYKRIETAMVGRARKVESGAWLIDRRVIDEIIDRDYFYPYLAGMIEDLGFKTKGIVYNRRARLRGGTKFNLVRYFKYAIDGLLDGSTLPLRFSFFCSLVIAFLAASLSVYFIVLKFILGKEFQEGVVAIIVLILLNFAFNFLFLGIIGEYIGRIKTSHSHSRPAIIDEKLGKN